MTTYRGPHVAVEQVFQTSPPAVAIESLPAVTIATAYDVYKKEMLGTSFGNITGYKSMLLPWGVNKVIHDQAIAGRAVYDFFPVKAYADVFGQTEATISTEDADETNVTSDVDGLTVGRDATVVIPGTEKVAGSCNAIIPYYRATTEVKIFVTDKMTVVITGGAVASAQIKAGQKVFILIGATWTPVGVVAAIGSDETKIKLVTSYDTAVDVTATAIIVGASIETAGVIDCPDCLFDSDANFIADGVRPGDIIRIASLAIEDSVENYETKDAVMASVVSATKNMIRFNTIAPAGGEEDYDKLTYKTSEETVGDVTVAVYAYRVERLLGFSRNLEYIDANLDPNPPNNPLGIQVELVNTTMFKIAIADMDSKDVLAAGDVFIMCATNAYPTESGNTLRANRVKSVITSGTDYVISTESPIYRTSGSSTPVAYEDGDSILAWRPETQTDILADFRAVHEGELNVVKRIASVQDIVAAWCKDDDIDVHNDLAFMANIAFSASGGKVMYGVNVDVTETSLVQQYTDALEALKLKDVYSHCFGTTDGGVNGLMAAYCDDQSAPYEAHERIGVLAYDAKDALLMASGTGDLKFATKKMTFDSTDLVAAGVSAGDVIDLVESDGTFITSVTITETPVQGEATKMVALTDYDGTVDIDGKIGRVLSGRKDDQAIRIGNLGLGNRRVSVIWPGWFLADFNGTRMSMPPYYIAAAICGMDSGKVVSQSFTNYSFTIPGLSNIELNTNTYFRKAQLDEIGGGGVDIMIQDSNITQSIKSRHDLTTNMDAVEYRERSIAKQADLSAKTIRNAVAPYVGKYNITPELIRFLGQVCTVVSSKLVKDGIIQKMSIISIKQDELVVDKINFLIEITVFVAGNYYDITLMVKSR